MVLTMARSEILNLLRENMTRIMLVYPFLLGGLGKFLISRGLVEGQLLGVIAVMLVIITGFAYGAAAGFSLLDDRDDQVLISVQISPVPLKLYIWLKVGLMFLLAVLSSTFVIWFLGTFAMALGDIVLVSVIVSLQVPLVAFLINALAQNKVEGFVAMKGFGFVLLLPAGGFFFLDAKEWLFAIAPGHWAAKAVQAVMLQPAIDAGAVVMNLPFYGYLGIGVIYNLVLVAIAYRAFNRRLNV